MSGNDNFPRMKIPALRLGKDRLVRILTDRTALPVLWQTGRSTKKGDDAYQIDNSCLGEILFLNNNKTLHGRSAFAADSARLLYRIRVHAGCLA